MDFDIGVETETRQTQASGRAVLGSWEARTIMNGSPEDVTTLWQQFKGVIEREDLEYVLPVQLGLWTEPLNLKFYAAHQGGIEVVDLNRMIDHDDRSVIHDMLVERGHNPEMDSKGAYTRFPHPHFNWTLVKPDGWCPKPNMFVQCKHIHQFTKPENAFKNFMPEAQLTMACTSTSAVQLSIFYGTTTHDVLTYERDDQYVGFMLARMEKFYASLKDDAPPNLDVVDDWGEGTGFDIKPDVTKADLDEKIQKDVDRSAGIVEMVGNNEWGDAAARWVANVEAKEKLAQAIDDLKELVPEKAAEARGNGVTVKVSKNGAKTIKPYVAESEKK